MPIEVDHADYVSPGRPNLHIPAQAVPQKTIESVMGASDSFVAGYLTGIVINLSFDMSI